MKIPFILILLSVMILSCGNNTNTTSNTTEENSLTTTFYLVRHAEKDLTVKKDPLLTEEGKERAQLFASYFKDIDAIYSTPYKRTQATALPTAKANNLKIKTYQPNQLFNKKLLEKHEGQNVLIVGHSNTIPQIVNKMTGETSRTDIPDEIYNRIYKVVFKDGKATATMQEKN